MICFYAENLLNMDDEYFVNSRRDIFDYLYINVLVVIYIFQCFIQYNDLTRPIRLEFSATAR